MKQDLASPLGTRPDGCVWSGRFIIIALGSAHRPTPLASHGGLTRGAKIIFNKIDILVAHVAMQRLAYGQSKSPGPQAGADRVAERKDGPTHPTESTPRLLVTTTTLRFVCSNKLDSSVHNLPPTLHARACTSAGNVFFSSTGDSGRVFTRCRRPYRATHRRTANRS